MDSVTQFALGAAVTVAAMGAAVKPARAVLIGGLVGTLPDLDVLIDHGDPVSNMTMHRAESHALLWLTLATPLVAWCITRLPAERGRLPRWSLAVWLTFMTHVWLDAMTVYGTQLLLPFTDHPFGVGSLFVIDPLYTLPLLVGIGVALVLRKRRTGLVVNAVGLALSTVYAGWSVFAQQHVAELARRQLERDGVASAQVLVTPAPLQTVLWRVVAVTESAFYEGDWSWCDGDPAIVLDRHDRGVSLHRELSRVPSVARLTWFSGGFVRLREHDGRVFVADLRMGQAPHFAFEFEVARREPGGALEPLPAPLRVDRSLDVTTGAAWIWRRMWGERLPRPQ